MKIKIKQILIFLFLVAILLVPYFVFAQDSNPTSLLKQVREPAGFADADEYSLSRLIGQVVNAILSLLGIVFISLMIYAGYNWMTASGDEAKLTQAKNTLRRAIIGLVILVGSFAIWNFIMFSFIYNTAG